MELELAPLDPTTDLPRVLALQHRLAPAHRHWQREQATRQLTDVGRAGGANVALAWRGSSLVGLAGWVALGAADGEFYASPVVAADRAVADRLLARVEEQAAAAGAAWLRVSSWPEEDDKATAIAGRGYRPRFDFVELAAELAALPEPTPVAPDGLTRVDFAAVDPARYAALFNDCFRDVANAPRIDPETAAAHLAEEPRLEPASQLWVDSAGDYQAFSITHTDGYVDSFGVRDGWQRRGVAAAMMVHTLAAARAAGLPRLTSTVASTNPASLAVHSRFGFAEVERCRVWQLDLAATPD